MADKTDLKVFILIGAALTVGFLFLKEPTKDDPEAGYKWWINVLKGNDKDQAFLRIEFLKQCEDTLAQGHEISDDHVIRLDNFHAQIEPVTQLMDSQYLKEKYALILDTRDRVVALIESIDQDSPEEPTSGERLVSKPDSKENEKPNMNSETPLRKGQVTEDEEGGMEIDEPQQLDFMTNDKGPVEHVATGGPQDGAFMQGAQSRVNNAADPTQHV